MMFFAMAQFLQMMNFCDDMASNIRVKVMSCQGSIYYIRMVNGEIEEFKEVGAVG